MTQFSLPRREHSLLEALVVQTPDATVLRRAQALLWVAAGDSVTAEHTLCVSVSSIRQAMETASAYFVVALADLAAS